MNDKLQAALEAVDQLAMRLDSSGRSDGVNDLHHAVTDALTTQAAVIKYLADEARKWEKIAWVLASNIKDDDCNFCFARERQEENGCSPYDIQKCGATRIKAAARAVEEEG